MFDLERSVFEGRIFPQFKFLAMAFKNVLDSSYYYGFEI